MAPAFHCRRVPLDAAPLKRAPSEIEIVTHRFLLTAFLSSVAVAAAAQTAPAQNQPQPVTRTAYMQNVDGAFTSIDKNKDGFADRAELEAAEAASLAARKAMVLRRLDATFQQMDANKDGNLTLTEFKAKANAVALPKADATPVLSKLDTNKDGKVSLAENRAPSMTQFDRADTNKDGTATVEERRAAGNR